MQINKNRLLTIDYIRILSMFAIVHFHGTDIIYSQNLMVPGLYYEPHYSMYNFSRYMSFSGFTIVFIFCYLMGTRHKAKSAINPLKVKIVLAGFFSLAAVYHFAYDSDIIFEWDIYHFLILSFAAFAVLKQKFSFKKIEVLIFGALSSIPFWILNSKGLAAGILFGNCADGGTGLWPIFPNIFFLFYGFSLGGYVADNCRNLSRRVGLLCMVMGVLLLTYASASYFRWTPIGPNFGCYIHRPPFLVWLSVVFGLSSLFVGGSSSALNAALSTNRLSLFVSSLAWNRHFGVSYLVQWVFLIAFYTQRGFFIAHPEYYFMVPFAILALTELSVRALYKWVLAR